MYLSKLVTKRFIAPIEVLCNKSFVQHNVHPHYPTCHWMMQPYRHSHSSTKPDFNDVKIAYQSKSTRELLRAFLVYQLFSFDRLVDSSDKLLKLVKRVFGRKMFHKLMKATVYGQFVAGEDLETLKPVMKQLQDQNIRSILDYAVEDDVENEEEVYMEMRQKGTQVNDLTDQTTHPQYSPSTMPASDIVKASARTYFYEGEQKCDENMENFLECINVAADASNGEDAFAAIKITGLGQTNFLLQLSQVLVGSENVFTILADVPSLLNGHITIDSFGSGLQKLNINEKESTIDQLFKELDEDNKGFLSMLQWYNVFQPEKNKTLYELLRKEKQSLLLPVMTDRDQEQMRSVIKRVETLADTAEKRGVRLMVDAEQTYYQPAIRHITVQYLMPKYNMKSPVIYNTQQCYLKKCQENVELDMLFANANDFHYGVKVVRGAYMEQERQRANEKGYEDPIWNTKAETDASYHQVLDRVMERVKEGRVHMMVASHNEGTIRYAIDKMSSLDISPNNGSVVFGQLLGMCDHVTFSLGSTGYLAYKYMPYGPVDEALPYLMRRANENRGMLAGAVRERELLVRELKRRLTQ